MNARPALFAALAIALASATLRGDDALPPPSLPDDLRTAANLCAPAFHPSFGGSLAPKISEGLWDGRAALREIRVPPQDLVIRWPRAVTLTAQSVIWESADVRGIWFGLEYWNAAQQRYEPIYEERDNPAVVTVRRFNPVTTTEVRFTIFAHVLRYDSIVMQQFGLYGAK